MAERINILGLKHPVIEIGKEKQEESDEEWTPVYICEAWAMKRGYFTAKASRPDVIRAANELLRMALDGRLCLTLKTPNYFKDIRKWSEHLDTIHRA